MSKLTEQQAEAFETYSQWLRDPGNYFAKLKGFAGTGKTYLTQHIIKDASTIMVQKWDKDFEEYVTQPFSICVTAPTHKAKNVVRKVARVSARTIQSLVGLAPNTDIDNFDINNPEFGIKNTPAMPKFDLIIVDESSMLLTGVKDIIISTALEHGVKVLFVYDSAQLPPVGEDIIPIDIDDSILISEEMTDIIRTSKSNPQLKTFTKIRDNLNSQTDAFTHENRISEDRTCGEVYIRNTQDFTLTVVKRFWSLYQKGTPINDKVLAWSNKMVSQWNLVIRTSIKNALKEKDPMHEFFLPNEPLISLMSIQDTIISNSEEYYLEDPEFVTKSVEYFERDAEKTPLMLDPKFVDINYIKGNLVCIETGQKEEVRYVVPEAKNYSNFLSVFKWYHSFGIIDRKWADFYAWKEQNLLLKDLETFYTVRGVKKKKLICKKDFDYAYALTVHKSQGSTYNNVYIDEVDIDQLEQKEFCSYLYDLEKSRRRTKFEKIKFLKDYPNFEMYYNKMQAFKNRLKYVAMSRSSLFMVMHTKKF